ncbi:hypothetical protein TWF281_006556 [Arthrobotrys megalospora]
MEVIQLAAGTAGLSAKHRAQHRRPSHVSLLISSNSVTNPLLASSPISFRYSRVSSSSASSLPSASSPFFLNDESDETEEVSSRSNTPSPCELPAYITSTSAAPAVDYRRSHYRSSLSRPLSYCNPAKNSVSAVPCDTTAGVSGSKACTTRPVRTSTLSPYDHKTDQFDTNCLASSSQRTDTGSRLSWYNPLLSERFQLGYVDESSEDLDDSDSCNSSDTEGPAEDKSVFQAIQESILFFNTISDIPLPAFVEKAAHFQNSLAPHKQNSHSPLSRESTDSQTPSSSSTESGHVKKPSLVSLDAAAQHSSPILDQDPDSLDDSDSLYNFSQPSGSASTSITGSLFPSKEAAEAQAREQIDLEIAAAIKESTRLEEERRAREAEEDAEFLRALHESIIAEKKAQARREDLEFLDRLFSKDRPVSPLSDCSSISSRSSVYSSCRNSTVLTVLSPRPSRSPIKSLPSTDTSSDMPSNPEEVPTPLSHSSRERPISAVREKKPKSKGSAVDLYEISKDKLGLRPTLQRAHTSTGGGFRRLLGLSGKNTHPDNSEDERYHAKSPRSSKKGDERPPMDRTASEPSTPRSSHRHRHHRHHSDEVERDRDRDRDRERERDRERDRESSHHRSHRHHRGHSETSSIKDSKRRSRDKPKAPEESPTKRSHDRNVEEAPIPTPPKSSTPIPEAPAVAVVEPAAIPPEAPSERTDQPVEGGKRRRKRHASLGDILRVSRKLKAGAPSEPAAPPEPPKLVECVTCLSDDIPETEAAQLECGHAFCNDCLVRLFDLSLTDPAHMPPRCCQPTQHIPLQHVDKLLSRKTKILWNKKYQEYTTVNRRYCPATDCGEWIKPTDFTNTEGVEVGTCPRCKMSICGLCGLKEHGKEECPKDEFLNQVRELGKELGWQRCYSCRAMVELERGCNHMTCRCTAEFCMICGAKWKTCECPWFNFPPEEDDAPPPRLDENGHLIDDLAWGWDPRTEDDERVARQLAADFEELDVNERDPHARTAWAPLFTGAIGEGVLRLLGRTRHLEGAALDRLRRAYATAFDDDFMLGDSDHESDDEVADFLGGNKNSASHKNKPPTLRTTQSDDYERRRRKRDSTYNLDWSPHHSQEDLSEGVDFGFLPQLTKTFLPRMFGGHYGENSQAENSNGMREDMGRYGDLLQGDLSGSRKEFGRVNWGGVGAA